MARTCAAGGVEAPLVRPEATSPHEIKPADPVVVVVGVGGAVRLARGGCCGDVRW
jgi:hypothetical protein